MSNPMRFGRRLSLPSTRQIRHELLQSIREDERRKALQEGAVARDAATIADPAAVIPI